MDPATLKRISGEEFNRRVSAFEPMRFIIGFIVVVVAILIGVGFAVYYGVNLNDEARARFMQQCMEDHKEYECTYLWRASARPGPDVIPIPLPIPMK